jgi:hypothetical protein
MPVGYNVVLHGISLEKFNKRSFSGHQYFVITNFERGDDRREVLPPTIKWHLQYHANPTTLEETVSRYSNTTKQFIGSGIYQLEGAVISIRDFLEQNKNQGFSLEYLDRRFGSSLSLAKFYSLSIEGIGKMILPEQDRLALVKTINRYLQVKEDFESYRNKNK